MKKTAIATHIRSRGLRSMVQKSLPRRRVLTFDDLKPRRQSPNGTNGMELVFGKWPGDETDEQIATALNEIE